MEFSTWLLFSCVALVSIISPGPAVLLSVTNSLRHGVMSAVFSSLGNIIGIFILSTAAALGLGAALQASTILFGCIKVCGAFYLIYLGICQWRLSIRGSGRENHNPFDTQVKTDESVPGNGGFFIRGVLVALSNPKAVLFFTALFPQFMTVSKPIAGQFFILTATFMGLSFLVLSGYAHGAGSLRSWLSRGRRSVWMSRVSGSVFIAMGLGILGLRNKTVLD